MAEEQSKGIQQIEGCEVIYDMGSGLVIAKVPLDKVKEQDINARIMKNEMQDQLTANKMCIRDSIEGYAGVRGHPIQTYL